MLAAYAADWALIWGTMTDHLKYGVTGQRIQLRLVGNLLHLHDKLIPIALVFDVVLQALLISNRKAFDRGGLLVA